MKKMYIAVLDEVGDFMVPTLVAHSVLGAHLYFEGLQPPKEGCDYVDWLQNSFRKVVIRVNRKEFEKIRTTLVCYEGHENTTLNGEKSCLVVLPVEHDTVPNVLKFAKMWKPKDSEKVVQLSEDNAKLEKVVEELSTHFIWETVEEFMQNTKKFDTQTCAELMIRHIKRELSRGINE